MTDDVATVWAGTPRLGRKPAPGELLVGNTTGNFLLGGGALDNTAVTQPAVDGPNMELISVGGVLQYGFAGFFGSFYDTTNQSNAGATSENLISCDSTYVNYGITCVTNGTKNTRFTAAHNGTYNLQFSCVFYQNNASAADIYIWFKKNGTNITQSNTRYTIGGKARVVAAWNFMYQLVSTDYIEIAWSSSDTQVSIAAEASSSNPTKPAVPSVIVTLALVR